VERNGGYDCGVPHRQIDEAAGGGSQASRRRARPSHVVAERAQVHEPLPQKLPREAQRA